MDQPRTPPGRGASSIVPVVVRPRQCDAQAMVHASRYYEFFEDAFLAWLDDHLGGYARLQALGVDLVIVESGCRHHRPGRLNDRLDVRVGAASVGTSSFTMAFHVERDGTPVATGTTTYVCWSAGARAALPQALRAAAGG